MTIEIPESAASGLETLCDEDLRGYDLEVAWLIREELSRRRTPGPNFLPVATTGAAQWGSLPAHLRPIGG